MSYFMIHRLFIVFEKESNKPQARIKEVEAKKINRFNFQRARLISLEISYISSVSIFGYRKSINTREI